VDASAGVLVPPVAPGLAGAFGLAVDQDWVYVFNPRRAGESARLLPLGTGDGDPTAGVTHGVSAVDEAAGVAYLVRGRGLLALDLVAPAAREVALRGGASLGGLVSMEWDAAGRRLLGLAVMDGYTALAQVDPLQGAVTPLSALPPCGDMECAPAQGVSALDGAGAGTYYAASAGALYAFSAADGSLVWYSALVPDSDAPPAGEDGTGGLASLEFGPEAGLLGVAVRGDAVEVVSVGTGGARGVRGAMRPLVTLLDSSLAGGVVAGVSAYRAGGPGSLGWYFVVSGDRFLSANLDTGLVSQVRPAADLAPSQLALMALVPFIAPVAKAPEELGAVADARPPPAPAPDIAIRGVGAALPLSASYAGGVDGAGAALLAKAYTFAVVGGDVAAGDSLLLAALGDCGAPVPGGGPFAIPSAKAANVTMVLSFRDSAVAQFCYRRRDARDALYQAMLWGGVGNEAGPALEVPLTVAAFVVCELAAARAGKCPFAMAANPWAGATLSVGLQGPLRAGDTLALVGQSPLAPADSLCAGAPALASSQLFGVVNDASRSVGVA
jgi:hypothetical protein